MDLPDNEWDRRRAKNELTPEEIKEKMKKMGLQPMTDYSERPTYVSTVGSLIDGYVPPEGEGKASMLSTAKGVELKDRTGKKGKTMMSIRKIRKYEDDFDVTTWVEEAMMIYRGAHMALAEGDVDKMHTYVTEKAFPEMMNMAKRKTIRWNFVKSLEPPVVVAARHGEILSKDNLFGQVGPLSWVSDL